MNESRREDKFSADGSGGDLSGIESLAHRYLQHTITVDFSGDHERQIAGDRSCHSGIHKARATRTDRGSRGGFASEKRKSKLPS